MAENNSAKKHEAASPNPRIDAEIKKQRAEQEDQRKFSDEKYKRRELLGQKTADDDIRVGDHVFMNVPIAGVVKEKFPSGDYEITDWKGQNILANKAFYIAYPDEPGGLVVRRNHPRFKVTDVNKDEVTGTLMSTLSPKTPKKRTNPSHLVFKAPPRT